MTSINSLEDFEALKRSAKDGDAEAQCAVGDICADDSRVDVFDVIEAAYWYEKAAMQGHTRAQWLIGACYLQGIGVNKDVEKAENWLLKSAQSGDTDGQFTLGGYYFMKPDIVKAAFWIEKAATLGHEDAKNMLGAIKQLMEF